MFFEAEVATLSGVGVLGPDTSGGLGLQHRPAQGRAGGGEHLAGWGLLGGREQLDGAGSFGRHPGDQGRQHRQSFAGAGVHAGLAVQAGLLVGGVAGADRTADRPRPPAGRVVVGPLGQVEVEGPYRGQHAAPVQPRPGDLAVVPGGLRAGEHPLLPRRGDVAGQLQRVDAGVMRLQIGPKQLAEQVGQPLQGGEVHRRLAFAQVVDQHVAHRAAGDAVAVDQLLATGLPAAEEHFYRGRRVRAEVAVRAQHLIEQRAAGVPVVGDARARGGGKQLEAVADPHRRDVSALDGHDDRDVGQRPLLALQSDPALTQRGELGERRAIAGAGHLGGQVVPGRGEPQQPVQAGPDHIGAEQHQQPRGQVRQRLGAVGAQQQTPVRLVLGAAGAPPLLPTVAGLPA